MTPLSASDIEECIDTAIQNVIASLFEATVIVGKQECTVRACENSAYAKGLCNAHYLRARSGRDLDRPIQRKGRLASCRECGDSIGGKGGWGLCKPHYRSKRRRLIRAVAVEALGGKCARCGGVFPNSVYDFHHLDPAEKDHDPSSMIDSQSISTIAAEIAKCALLCANCHRIEHHG